MKIKSDYHTDFYAWLMKNAQLLRQHQFSEVDVEQIAEELESMGRSEKREMISRLTALMAHLLKWQFQVVKRSKSWKNTISIQRIDILELLQESPSLKYEIQEKIEMAYEKAKLSAEDETGIDQNDFPKTCPFTLEQLLNKDFLPKEKD
jgi:hypothetical protein